MKRILILASAVFLVLGAVGIGSAATLTFDDIGSLSIGMIPNGYGGFQWSEFGYLNSNSGYAGSGYANGTVSGDYVAFNNYARVANVNDGSFTFNGAFLTAAWRDGLNIEIQGYLGGILQNQTIVTVDHDGPIWVDFNSYEIDSLAFRSFGGTEVPGLQGSGAHFAMDNFTFNETAPAPAPEPTTMLLVGSGLIGITGLRRKFKR